MTIITSDLHASTPRSVAIGRSYQHLNGNDRPRIAAFFLSFDFDQRRSYFGGGISDHSILEYCRTIDWTTTDMIARSARYCLEALATIVALPPDGKAELAVACPLLCDQRRIVAELLDNVIAFAATRYRVLVIGRELAHPELIAELRRRELATAHAEEIEVDLGSLCPARSAGQRARLFA